MVVWWLAASCPPPPVGVNAIPGTSSLVSSASWSVSGLIVGNICFPKPHCRASCCHGEQSDKGSGAPDRALQWNLESVAQMLLRRGDAAASQQVAGHVRVQALQDNTEAPQLPASYPAMVLLALVPPLFFSIIDRRLDDYQEAAAAAPTAGAE